MGYLLSIKISMDMATIYLKNMMLDWFSKSVNCSFIDGWRSMLEVFELRVKKQLILDIGYEMMYCDGLMIIFPLGDYTNHNDNLPKWTHVKE